MALIEKLEAIGDAIRSKTGGSEELTLDEMVDEIEGISGGGVTQPLIMTEIQEYTPPTGVDGFSKVTPKFNLNIESFYNYMQAENIASILGISNINKITEQRGKNGLSLSNYCNGANNIIGNNIEYIFDFENATTLSSMSSFFNSCTEDLKNWTKLNFINYNNLTSVINSNYTFDSFFYSNQNLSELPINLKNFIMQIITNIGDKINSFGNFAYNCRVWYGDEDLKNKIATRVLESFGKGTHSTSSSYNSTFRSNYLYHNIKIDPFYGCTSTIYCTSTPNIYTFYECCARHLIFKPFDTTREDYSYRNWNINLSSYFGYCDNSVPGSSLHKVADLETYNLYKDDPLGVTWDKRYSFYNHDSAVETLNSLPDMTLNKYTGTATYTIKFEGAAGSLTPEGAINTLTAEEIAVATDKGWTVSLV